MSGSEAAKFKVLRISTSILMEMAAAINLPSSRIQLGILDQFR
jgi:hypothetical protein